MSDISGIFQGDLIIKTMLELSIDDMRKNPWLIEDCFSSLVENPILKKKYGLKEIQRAKEFILNNKIPVYMRHRLDKQEFPCITLSIGESREDESLATLGDSSPCIEDLDPCDIGKSIKYIIPPFDIVSYEKSTGTIEIPDGIYAYRYLSEGMVAVDPDTGNGFIIKGKSGNNKFQIAANSELPSGKLGIVPKYHLFRARRERATSQEVYNIGCHVEGDISTLIFLHSVVKYAIYRYREALLEHENFQLSRLSSSDMIKNGAFDVENVYSRFLTLRGQVEESWIKSPQRFIEGVDIIERNVDGGEETLEVGIKILGEEAPDELNDPDCDLWVTIDE